MAEHASMVVTDGRVLLGSAIEDRHTLTVIPRDVRVDGQTLRTDERDNAIRALAHERTRRGRLPQVDPPQREHFLAAYQQLATRHSQLVSIHLLHAFDGAAREARICHQLLQPVQQIAVYEAPALEGGLAFVLQTALALAQEGATAPQILALLRYLETHMHTLLLTPGTIRTQHVMMPNAVQRARSLIPGTETLWHLDPKERVLRVIGQGQHLLDRIGALLHTHWGGRRYTVAVRYRGYTKRSIDQLVASVHTAKLSDAVEIEPVTASFVPGMPADFIELLLLPTAADLQRLRGLVQDPIWWKGTA